MTSVKPARNSPSVPQQVLDQQMEVKIASAVRSIKSHTGGGGGDYLPLSGGTMTGPIKGTGEMLHGRAALQLMAGSETPVVINSGSTYRPAFSIFGYNAGEPDNRGPVIELKANGDIHLTGTLTADGGVVDSTISRKIEALEARIESLEARLSDG